VEPDNHPEGYWVYCPETGEMKASSSLIVLLQEIAKALEFEDYRWQVGRI
jgi:hypothetical protein